MTPRIPPFARAHDLLWYYREGDGDMGQAAQSYEPTTHSVGLAPQGYSDRVVDATTRHRRIFAALCACGPLTEMVLRAAYALPSARLARLDAELLGELGPACALLLARAGRDVEALVAAARRDASARAVVREAVAETERAIRAAQNCYVMALRETDR